MYLFAVKPYTPQGDVQTLLDTLEQQDCLLALPYSRMGEFSNYQIGALDIPSVDPNAFTAPIAGQLPKSMNAKFALIKDPEKGEALWENGVEPFFCIGERLEDVQAEKSAEVITRQLTAALGDNPDKAFSLVYTAPWIDDMEHLPTEEELQHRFDFCKDLVHSLYPSKPTVYCISPTWAPNLKADEFFIRF